MIYVENGKIGVEVVKVKWEKLTLEVKELVTGTFREVVLCELSADGGLDEIVKECRKKGFLKGVR